MPAKSMTAKVIGMRSVMMMPVSASAAPRDHRRTLLGVSMMAATASVVPHGRPRDLASVRSRAAWPSCGGSRVRFVPLRGVHRRECRLARALVLRMPVAQWDTLAQWDERGAAEHTWHSEFPSDAVVGGGGCAGRSRELVP